MARKTFEKLQKIKTKVCHVFLLDRATVKTLTSVLKTKGRAIVTTPAQTRMVHSAARVLWASPWALMALLVMTSMSVRLTMGIALRSVSTSLAITRAPVLMDMSTRGRMALMSSALTLVRQVELFNIAFYFLLKLPLFHSLPESNLE